jgi:hypothetical protein
VFQLFGWNRWERMAENWRVHEALHTSISSHRCADAILSLNIY